MLQKFDQPIIAIATAPGRGAVGIVRLSAKSLRPFIFSLLGRDLNAREATYLAIRDSQQEIIDHGIAIYFESPNSYTGEDVLELQVHGGAIILDLIISRCFEVARVKTDDSTGHRLENLRMAQAGEFTQRAFLNDKMDLAQAEAVADLIDATTEAAAKSASRALSGVFSKQIEELTHAIVRLRMLVEATLDFPEEEIDFLEKANAKTRLDAIIERIQTLQKQSQQGALLQNGMSVVIAGQPNAGKSSLLNALAGAELAIVTPIAGTTRDKVAQTIQIKGVPIHVIDTAGLREGLDEVEKIGIKRSWLAIEKADAVIFLHDLSRQGELAYQEGDAEIRQVLSSVLTTKTPVLDCWNKLDTSGQTAPNIDKNVVKTREDAIYLSAKTGVGLDVLREKLLMIAGWQPDGGCIFSARKRHVEAILDAKSHLILASRYLNQKAENLDLLAEELRLAQDCLSQITGEFTPDDLLGVIFKEFCIGK